jgi:hypothetical protein
MHIIFGKAAAESISDKHTVLELDTITIRGSAPIVVYCVIEHVPLEELPKTESLKELHTALMDNYRKRNWSFCDQALEHLVGSWNGEADTFYQDLNTRIAKYKEEDPGESWTGIIDKN